MRLERGGVGDVELGAAEADDVVAGVAGGEHHVAAEHPGGSGHEQLHRAASTRRVSISELSPTSSRRVFGIAVAAGQLHVAAEQAGLHPGAEVLDHGAGEDDRVLDLGAADVDVVADRGVGADVGVLDVGAGADHGRAADDRAAQRGAGLEHDPALDPGLLVDLALDLGLQLLEHEPVGLEHVGELAGVLPPAADDLGADRAAVVDQLLDRLGDLELAAPGGLERAGGVEDQAG